MANLNDPFKIEYLGLTVPGSVAMQCRNYRASEVSLGMAAGLTAEQILAADRAVSTSGIHVSLTDMATAQRGLGGAMVVADVARALRAVVSGSSGATAPTKPWPNPVAAEIGQLWVNDSGYFGARTERLISIDLGRVFFESSFSTMKETMLDPVNGWRCVGYQLDDGRRVMVGERWERSSAEGLFTADSIVAGGKVWLEHVDGNLGAVRGAAVLLDVGGPWRRVGPCDQGKIAAQRANLGEEFNEWWRVNGLCAPTGTISEEFATEMDADDVHPTVEGFARLFRAVASDECERDIARQRVDAAIAAYRGPYVRAFGAALRAAAEVIDLAENTVEQVVAKVLGYETALQRGMRPERARQEVLDDYEWELVERALDVYQRERGR